MARIRRRIRMGVIFGGRSVEHDVSLMSARSILGAIDPHKYEITQIGIARDGAWFAGDQVLDALTRGDTAALSPVTLLPDPTRGGLLALRTPNLPASLSAAPQLLEALAELDVIFPVVHGALGEDGTLQGLFEMAGLAYVGAGVLGSAVGMDKDVFKAVMRSYDIPVVDWILVTRQEIEQNVTRIIERAMHISDFPLFVKPANLGSSMGITRCKSRSDLMEGLFEAARYDRRILIERGVYQAREIEVGILGNDSPQASVPGEIVPSREFYSYESRYFDGSSGLLVPAPISPKLARQIQELALRAYRAIDCAGMAQVDFLLAPTGSHGEPGGLYLSEVNTIPSFTPVSLYPKLWEASELPYPALINRLVELALERRVERDHTERRFHRGGSK